MKKQIFSGILAATILSSYANAAFTDISSQELLQTANILKSLKIMQGDSSTTFAPSRNLTRAEFSKLLVTMLGITDVSAYRNYTIFPDVPSTHWAAGYINAAVRHPDLQKKNIIKGYADGTFKPNNTINYGEACTMLLLALGYTVDEIGPMWPNDYVSRAESLGLKPDNKSFASSTIMSREDAAYMLFNAIMAQGKDGKIIDSLTSSSDSDGAILMATSKTDSELKENQAKFYVNGEIITKNTEGTIDESMIGMRGTLYYSKQNSGSVITIVPDNTARTETYNVTSVQANKIETKEGKTIKPSNDTMVYLNGSVGKFGENWFNLLPDDEITLHYDSSGSLTLIRTSARQSSNTSFVYGTKSERPIPEGYKIIKNGYEISRDKLKQYDVVILEMDTKTAKVSDDKLTGIYENAAPSYQNPSKITVLGKEFNISQNAASYFSSLAQSSKITLLLDSYGSVAAAYPSSTVSTSMIGMFQSVNDGKAQIRLLNGITVKVDISDNSKQYVGRMVSITQNENGRTYISEWNTNSSKPSGNWNIKSGQLGGRQVSPNVTVWEKISDYSPLYQTDIKDLPFDEIKSSDIKNVVIDSSGVITGIIIGDVTGDAWNYGLGDVFTEGTEETEGEPEISAFLRYYDYTAGAESRLTYKVYYRPSGANGQPIGFPKSAENSFEKQYLDSIVLKNIANVKLTDFDGSEGVRTNNGYYKISDEVQVYVRSLRKFITLNQAKADYTNFELYAERTADQGGKIRMIIVS